MGWTTTYRAPGLSHQEFFHGHGMRYDNEKASGAIIAMSAVGSTVYGAFKVMNKETGDERVIALIILTGKGAPGDRYYNFSYKEMEENSGPYETCCPASIFKLLTPLPPAPTEGHDPYEYARQWRARCEANLASGRAIVKGGYYKLSEPLGFGNGRYPMEFFQVVSTSPWVIRGYYALLDGYDDLQVKFPRARLQAMIGDGQATASSFTEMSAYFHAKAASKAAAVPA